jgi:uncharacterized protein
MQALSPLGRLLVACLALWLLLPHARAEPGPGDLTIETAGKEVRFAVELVDTPMGRAQGLMHRETLPQGTGMLFDFHTEQPVSFWMRNTLIPLDMLFIDSGGRILRIHARAQPLDETQIPSIYPVQAVLEIGGGEAERLGIAVGDRVRHPIFGR